MGEVWRATDTRLNREVAIKVLPAAVAGDAMRLARFTREAQVLASLNHPNIAAIYGVEEHALVMELVEGPTLAERIAGRAMPIDDALGIARQMAEALGYAHDKGVVHRDLKPANIKITPEGTVKILDFGLAKAMSTDASASGPGEATTLNSAATMAGTILGTAAYMAPEQARGQNVDRRADVWAFGVVLYEMLTGERPFGGATVSDTLAAILTAAPDLERVPAGARPLLRRCLQKDPKQRLRDVGDAEILLENPFAAAAPARAAALPWALLGIVVAAAVALGFLYWRERPLAPAPVALSLLPPPQFEFAADPIHNIVAVSPHGDRVVFSAAGADGTGYLWLRRLDSVTSQRLNGTANAISPFWSPDGQEIGFGQNGELMRMDLAGGPPVALASAPDLWGASWGSRAVIVYAESATGTLLQIPAQGGIPISAAGLAMGTGRAPAAGSTLPGVYPWFLPDGQHFLFVQSDGTIRLGTLDSSATRVLVTQASSDAIYASGNLLFKQGSTLMAQPFDVKRLALTGGPAPIATVAGNPLVENGAFAASSNGTLAFLPPAGAGAVLGWYDPNGKLLSTVQSADITHAPNLSPDGRRALTTVNGDLWIVDFATGTRTQFSFDGKSSVGIWSPDGRQIAFGSSRGGHWALYREPSDGSAPAQVLYDGSAQLEYPSSWSSDGKFLLASTNRNSKTPAIGILSLSGGERLLLLGPGTRTVNGQFSPDGRWIAFQGMTGEGSQIYLTPFPGPGGMYRVSLGDLNEEPRWSRDGKWLYYLSGRRELMVAGVQAQGASAEVRTPQPLFGPVANEPFDEYDIAAGGTRVLALRGSDIAPTLTVIQHWPQALKH